MAEEFLVTKELTETKVEDGAKVLACLDRDGFPVQAAFWRFDFDARAWHFFIISPGVWSRIREAYRKMSEVMQELGIKELDYRLTDEREARYREVHRNVTFFSKTPKEAPSSWPPLGIAMGEDLHVYRI